MVSFDTYLRPAGLAPAPLAPNQKGEGRAELVLSTLQTFYPNF